jgi:hypothetical protein
MCSAVLIGHAKSENRSTFSYFTSGKTRNSNGIFRYHILSCIYTKNHISIFLVMISCKLQHSLKLFLMLFIPICFLISQSIRIIQCNTSIYCLIHLYMRLHVSAAQSHHQASSQEKIYIRYGSVLQ